MSYNAKNQITSTGKSKDFSYDANGNMLRGNAKSYTYNAFNKVARLNSSLVAYIGITTRK